MAYEAYVLTPGNDIFPKHTTPLVGQRYHFRAINGLKSTDYIRFSNTSEKYPVVRQDGMPEWSIPYDTFLEVLFVGTAWMVMGTVAAGQGVTVLQNIESFTIYPGQPVKLAYPGVKLAQANSVDNTAFGIAGNQAEADGLVIVVYIGIMKASDWFYATGSTYVTPNDKLFLHPGTLGFMQAGSPSASGDITQFLATVVDIDTVFVDIKHYGII